MAQQKCLAHLIRNASAVAEEKTGRGKQFSEQLKKLLQQALALAAEKNGIDAADYRERVKDLDDQLTFHLRDRVLR